MQDIGQGSKLALCLEAKKPKKRVIQYNRDEMLILAECHCSWYSVFFVSSGEYLILPRCKIFPAALWGRFIINDKINDLVLL